MGSSHAKIITHMLLLAMGMSNTEERTSARCMFIFFSVMVLGKHASTKHLQSSPDRKMPRINLPPSAWKKSSLTRILASSFSISIILTLRSSLPDRLHKNDRQLHPSDYHRFVGNALRMRLVLASLGQSHGWLLRDP